MKNGMIKMFAGVLAVAAGWSCLAAAPEGMVEIPAKVLCLRADGSLSNFSGWWLNDGKITFGQEAGAPEFDFRPWYDFGTPHVIKAMDIGTFEESYKNVLRGATLQGSSDNVNWTTIYTIPDNFEFKANTIHQLVLDPVPAAARYVRLRSERSLLMMTEFVLYTDEPAIRLNRPVTWAAPSQIQSPIPNLGVSLSGTVLSTVKESLYLRAYVAIRDLGDDLAAWKKGCEQELDLGTVAPGGTFDGRFNYTRRGKRHFWRVFGTADDRVVVSQPGSPFITQGELFYPAAYVMRTNDEKLYDGRLDVATDGTEKCEIVFDLQDQNNRISKQVSIGSVRLWGNLTPDTAAQRMTFDQTVKFGYRGDRYVDWGSTKVVRNYTDDRPTFQVGAIPSAIEWRYAQDPIYTCIRPDDPKVAELVIEVPAETPDYIYVSARQLLEVELRTVESTPGLFFIVH